MAQPILPQSEEVVSLDADDDEVQGISNSGTFPIKEACIEIRVLLNEATLWAPEGHVLTEIQLPVRNTIINTYSNISKSSSSVMLEAAECRTPVIISNNYSNNQVEGMGKGINDHGRESLTVADAENPSTRVSFDKETGCIVGFTVNGQELLAEPISVCLYRAPTDNDRGGTAGRSYAARWKKAGLDRLHVIPGSCKINQEETSAGTMISVSYNLAPGEKNNDIPSTIVEGVGVGEVGGTHWLSDALQESPGQEIGTEDSKVVSNVAVQLYCRLLKAGGLEMRWEIDTRNALPGPLPSGLMPSLPRVGINMGIDSKFAGGRVTWFGNGPHECYSDRKAGAFVRLHTVDNVNDLHVPYIFPSESGGRCDCRWVALQGSNGALVAVAGGGDPSPLCQFSASHFSIATFEKANHDHELVADDYVHLCLDTAHMGVGGDDSWSPSVHSQYLVPPDKIYAFRIILVPILDDTRVDVSLRANELWHAAFEGLANEPVHGHGQF